MYTIVSEFMCGKKHMTVLMVNGNAHVMDDASLKFFLASQENTEVEKNEK